MGHQSTLRQCTTYTYKLATIILQVHCQITHICSCLRGQKGWLVGIEQVVDSCNLIASHWQCMKRRKIQRAQNRLRARVLSSPCLFLRLRYCLFGLKDILDFRTRFSTKICFGSKEITRVGHVEFEFLWSYIGQEIYLAIFGSQRCVRLKPLLRFTR